MNPWRLRIDPAWGGRRVGVRDDLGWVADVLLAVKGADVLVSSTPPAGHEPTFTFLALPSGAKPYVLVPPEPVLAKASLRNVGNAVVWRLRVAEELLGQGLGLGIPQWVRHERVYISFSSDDGASHPTLLDHFQELFHRSDLSLGVILGQKRPNRKPVIKILSSQGECLGFAKVGWNEISRALVKNEAHVLQSIAELAIAPESFRVPKVLEYRQVGDAELLVTAPIPPRRAGNSRRMLRFPMEVAKEISALEERPTEVFAQSSYWSNLKSRIGALKPGGGPVRALGDGVERLESRYGAREITFGAWHGDFTPWNMSRSRGTLSIWDWERSGGLVPVGLDAARFDLDVRLKIKRERARDAVHRSVMSLGPTLEAMGAEAGTATLVTTLHALEMVLRFEEARAAGVRGREPLYEVAIDEMIKYIRPVRAR
jgi:hypothetical protein